MSVFIVTYDLKKIGQNYTCITGKLEALKAFHAQGSVWFVNSNGTVAAIRNHLQPCLDANDILFVGLITKGNWASTNMTALATWMANNGA